MMMMHQKPTVYIPTMSYVDDIVYNSDDSDEADSMDTFTSDEFRMYEFKIRRCARARSHDWTECPFAHPGEKARRRDPRKFHYSGTACPDFRKGNCKRGDSCDMAHGVFECWLHPARYRTQPCKDGTACRRRVCFFAHTPDQLRVLATSPKTPLESYDGSPMRKSTVMMINSPPMSPTSAGNAAMLMNPFRKLQLEKVNSMPVNSMPVSGGGGFGLPRFCSLPSTPTRAFNGFDRVFGEEREERVESGRALRAKMYERRCKESALMEKKGPDVE